MYANIYSIADLKQSMSAECRAGTDPAKGELKDTADERKTRVLERNTKWYRGLFSRLQPTVN